MIIGMTASICSLVYTFLIFIVYLKKAKLRNDENVIYGFMIFFNIGGLLLEFLVYLFAMFPNVEYSLIPSIVEKCYLIHIFSWIYLFTIYIYIISFDKKSYNYNIVANKKVIVLLMLIYLIFISLIVCLPIKHTISASGTYSTGPALNVLVISAAISIVFDIIFIIINFKKLEFKKKLPLISLIMCSIFMLILRVFIPEALFVSTMFAFVTILTFFTIENPDIRIAKELAYANEEVKRSKDNTLNTLNDLSSKLQNSLSKLETFGYKKTDTNDIEELKKDLNYIKKYCINFVDKVNGIIEISKLNSGSLEINEYDYETDNMFDEINKIISNKDLYIKKDKLPNVLYGDKSKIEQTILLMYKYLSKKGNINIKIDYLIAGRFCKLKFYFSSKDINIKDYIYNIDNYNYIFYENNDNIEYDNIIKLISLLDGNIEIINKKDIVLSINQRIINPYKDINEKEENKNIKVRYYNLSNKRILLVDDSVNDIRDTLLLLKPYKVNVDVAKNFNDMRKYLESNKTYDLILIDDIIYGTNLEEYSVDVYKRLSGYHNFKSIIMLSNSNKTNINNYLDNGYNDYILKPINKKNINEILNKYLNK